MARGVSKTYKGMYDKRVKIPTVLGHFAVAEDEECLLLSVHSPGAFGGAYMMVLAFPMHMKPDLTLLDNTLRREWFHEKCPHLSMFVKRDTGSVEEKRKMYNWYKESMKVSKKTADMKFLESSTNGYQRPDRVVWAREYRLGGEEATRLVEMWKNDPGHFKWSFYRSLYGRRELPLPVERWLGSRTGP